MDPGSKDMARKARRLVAGWRADWQRHDIDMMLAVLSGSAWVSQQLTPHASSSVLVEIRSCGNVHAESFAVLSARCEG